MTSENFTMGCVGWKKQLTSSKLWAKNSKKLALQYPLQGQVTNGLTSARLPLFRALPPSGSVTCWLPWHQCVTLGGCRPTAIHSSAKGTTASLTSLLKSPVSASSAQPACFCKCLGLAGPVCCCCHRQLLCRPWEYGPGIQELLSQL